MKENKIFLDTNIIIYAYDRSAGKKHEIAKNILIDLWNSGLGCLSTQVLKEFFVIVTGKTKNHLDLDSAKQCVKDFLKWNIVINDGQCIIDGIDLHKKFNYSFWDSMIIQAAIKSRAKVLLSEDMQSGHIVEGVEIINPFL